jgi:hypothetical protein
VGRAIQTALSKNSTDRFPNCWSFACATLADVAPAKDEPGVARLLCPNSDCNNNLKLPASAAGQRGKCPRCSNAMIIAPDLSALWLVREESNEPVTSVGTSEKPAKKHIRGRRRSPSKPQGGLPARWRRWLLVAGGLTLMFYGAVVVSQISAARERLEHNRTAGELRRAEKKISDLEQSVRVLTAAKAAIERENAALREAAP